MHTAEPGSLEADEQHGDDRTGRRRWVVAVAVAAVLGAGFVVWWLATAPRLEGGGLAGVSSPDHEVVWASGLHESVFAVPADGPGSSTVAFGIHNDGRLPVELVDVWPSMDDPLCFWQPTERWFQDDPQHRYRLDDRARPAQGAVLEPGGSATIWVTGAHPNPDDCTHAGLNSSDDVEVIARIGGRTSTRQVPLGFTFGYADDPEMLRDVYDVQVLTPSEEAVGN